MVSKVHLFQKCCNSNLMDYPLDSNLAACNGGVSLVDQNLMVSASDLHLPASKRLKIS